MKHWLYILTGLLMFSVGSLIPFPFLFTQSVFIVVGFSLYGFNFLKENHFSKISLALDILYIVILMPLSIFASAAGKNHLGRILSPLWLFAPFFIILILGLGVVTSVVNREKEK